MGRLCRNRDYVAFAQMVGHSSFERGGAYLISRGPLGLNHSPSHYQRGLAFDHDEHVVGMVVVFNQTSFPALRQDNQSRIADDWPAFGHHFGDLVVADVMNRRRDTATE